MTYVATLTITTSTVQGTFIVNRASSVFNFAIANLDPPGAIPDVLEPVQEELTDPGVDGRRWRRINRQFPPFVLETVADEATYAAGLATARNYRLSNGSIANLSITLDGNICTVKNVKIQGIVPRVMKGVLIGSGATASSACVIHARWNLVLADPSTQGKFT